MMHNVIAVIIVLCVVVFFRLYEPPPKAQSADVLQDTTALAHDTTRKELIVRERYAVNPNTASLEELQHAGFSKRQAYTCIKYRNSGAVFRYKDDVAKLYTVTAEDYENLKDYIDLPEKSKQLKEKKNSSLATKRNAPITTKSENAKRYEKKTYEATHIVKQDLNTIDSAGLTKIPFIGAFRARKIVEARSKWGGFYSISQLKSLYSFDSIACANVEKYCYINLENIRKIDINTCTFRELQNLPASSYHVAKHIFDYKRIVGTIQNAEELVSNNIVERDKFEVLRYYLKPL
jgi:DNA uptake protein ComE-like DNA-binding protein